MPQRFSQWKIFTLGSHRMWNRVDWYTGANIPYHTAWLKTMKKNRWAVQSCQHLVREILSLKWGKFTAELFHVDANLTGEQHRELINMFLYSEYQNWMGDIYTCATLNTDTLEIRSAKVATSCSLSSQFNAQSDLMDCKPLTVWANINALCIVKR